MNNATNITIRVAIGALVLVLVVAFSTWYFVLPRVGQQAEQATTDAAGAFLQSQYQDAVGAHNQLEVRDPAYAEASRLYWAGQYTDAAKQYRSVLARTSDPAESAVIKFWLAFSEEASGNYTEAIAIYKDIAASTSTLSRVTRAYAVQDLAHMYYRYGDTTITKEIFKDEPYKTLFNTGRVLRSYRNLFDYAASLYPLAFSELSSADWYVNQLLAGTTTRPQYPDIIREKVRLAEENILILRSQPSQTYELVNALEIRAVILGKMKRLGDSSLGDPDEAFKELLNYYETRGLRDESTARLQYAYYLSNMYGKERTAEIENVLAPIDADPSAHGLSLVPLFKNVRSGRPGAKANLVLLASIDPKFKALLVSLGWTDADFK